MLMQFYDNDDMIHLYRSTKWCWRDLGEVHGSQAGIEAGVDANDQPEHEDGHDHIDNVNHVDLGHLPKMSMW